MIAIKSACDRRLNVLLETDVNLDRVFADQIRLAPTGYFGLFTNISEDNIDRLVRAGDLLAEYRSNIASIIVGLLYRVST